MESLPAKKRRLIDPIRTPFSICEQYALQQLRKRIDELQVEKLALEIELGKQRSKNGLLKDCIRAGVTLQHFTKSSNSALTDPMPPDMTQEDFLSIVDNKLREVDAWRKTLVDLKNEIYCGSGSTEKRQLIIN